MIFRDMTLCGVVNRCHGLFQEASPPDFCIHALPLYRYMLIRSQSARFNFPNSIAWPVSATFETCGMHPVALNHLLRGL